MLWTILKILIHQVRWDILIPQEIKVTKNSYNIKHVIIFP